MADGELVLRLDDETARRLQAAADSAGRSVTDYAIGLLAHGLGDNWIEALRRLEEYDRTGESYPAEEVLAEFEANVNRRAAKRA